MLGFGSQEDIYREKRDTSITGDSSSDDGRIQFSR